VGLRAHICALSGRRGQGRRGGRLTINQDDSVVIGHYILSSRADNLMCTSVIVNEELEELEEEERSSTHRIMTPKNKRPTPINKRHSTLIDIRSLSAGGTTNTDVVCATGSLTAVIPTCEEIVE
jgi:hypothetical protein